MPRPYAGDLRRRVVAAVAEAGRSRGPVARRFAVGRSTVCRWAETAREEGRLEAKPMHGGRPPAARGPGRGRDRAQAPDRADHHPTLAGYRDHRLAEEIGVRVHPWTLGRALKRLGRTREKEEDAACRRAGRGRDRGGARARWRETAAGVAPERLAFLIDESARRSPT
jgi:transposase